MRKVYRSYSLDQPLLLPPDVRDWVPEGHLALFVHDVVAELDLESIFALYEQGNGRGKPPYHPRMMVALLLYAYCIGMSSSRKIEAATYIDIGFRVLTADQHPDHSSISEFRHRHLSALAELFVQVLRLCQKSGLVTLGHVALDGTKILANASKHKAMSYDRMCQTEQQLQEEVKRLLELAEQVDAQENVRYGEDKRGDELPAELSRRQSRLVVIRAAKAALEEEAKEKTRQEAEAAKKKIEERVRKEAETGKKPSGRTPVVKDPEQTKPDPKAQRNFTDPESRIMKDGATGSFVQAYNAQIVVDSHCQIILAASVTPCANDREQLLPMLCQAAANAAALPPIASADCGYFNQGHMESSLLADVDLFVPPCRERALDGKDTPFASELAQQMRAKLGTVAGKAVYSRRKAIVEPVFGQVKEARGFRRFSFRGRERTDREWTLICLTHNVLKLFRHGGGGCFEKRVAGTPPRTTQPSIRPNEAAQQPDKTERRTHDDRPNWRPLIAQRIVTMLQGLVTLISISSTSNRSADVCTSCRIIPTGS
jgi:transposase